MAVQQEDRGKHFRIRSDIKNDSVVVKLSELPLEGSAYGREIRGW